MLEAFLADLTSAGWTVVRNATAEDRLPARYTNVPDSVRAFVCAMERCTNAAETAWFLCGPDFGGTAHSAFQWNEFELLSLEAAAGDSAWEHEIRSFWDCHLPLLLSTRGCYSYFAMSLSGPSAGAILRGTEPEFEATAEVAPSFEAFLELVRRSAAGESVDQAVAAAL